MKRVISLLLAIICVFSAFALASCDDGGSEKVSKLDGKTPLEAIEAAIPGLEKTVKDPEMYFEVSCNMTMGEDRSEEMYFVTYNREVYSTEKYSSPYGKGEQTIVYLDGVLYNARSYDYNEDHEYYDPEYDEDYDEKYKYEVDEDEVFDSIIDDVEDVFEMIDDIQDDYSDEYNNALEAVKESGLLDSLKFTKSGSKYTLKIDVAKIFNKLMDDPDVISDALDRDLREYFDEYVEEIEEANVKINKAQLIIVFDKDGNITQITGEADLTFEIDGRECTFNGSISMQPKAGSGTSKIKKPSDASSYEEDEWWY